MRRGRETLLTLLEAFVYDPLLDWTSHDTGIISSFYGGGARRVVASVSGTDLKDTSSSVMSNNHTKGNRRTMEKKMTHRLLAIRLIENRTLAEKNEEQLLKLLTKLESRVNVVCELIEKYENKEELIHLFESAKIYLDESLTLHSENSKTKGGGHQHAVYSLHDRYAVLVAYEQSLARIYKVADELLELFNDMKSGQKFAMDFIKNSNNIPVDVSIILRVS